ncbi:transposase family protein, partial [Piscibacillus halophilus]
MHSNIFIPGLEEFIVTNASEKGGMYQLHVELKRKPHRCPACGNYTDRIHDYRVQKIQHTQAFGRPTVLFYRKRR